MAVRPFTIKIPDDDIDDLLRRLARTRWPDQMDGSGWEYGTDPDYLRDVVWHWRDGFDWRVQEQRLNACPQYHATIEGVDLHFVHMRGAAPDAMPLLLLHGWPSTFVQMLDLAPMLADPAAHGGDRADSFDVVIGSLPGYGFSGTTTDRPMTRRRIGQLFHRLLSEELGYRSYGVRASDIGAGVQLQMALEHPEAVVGMHVSGSRVPYVPENLTEGERAYLDAVHQWEAAEGAYAHLHRTKPQTLAYGLNDSPVGLAAWIIEKFRAWSDCEGDLGRVYRLDDLLTNISIYWFTRTINASMRVYRDGHGDDTLRGIPDVPTAHLMTHEQILNAPQEWTRRFYRIDRYVEVEQGGHFLEWEQPQRVADDLRAFFRSLR